MKWGVVVIFAIIGVTSVLLARKLYRSWISPLSLYSIVWSIVPILYFVSPLPWPELSSRTVAAILVAWFSFLLGCITISLGPRKKGQGKIFISETFLRKMIIFYSIIGLIGSISAITKLINHFGIETILTAPWLVRHQITLTGEGPRFTLEGAFLLSFTVAGSVMAGVYWGYFGFKRVVIIPFLAAFIYELSRLGRWELLWFLLFYLFGWVVGAKMSGKKFNIQLIHLGVIGISIVFIILMTFFVGKSGEYLVPLSNIWLPSLVLVVFNRLNGPIEGLDWVLHLESPIEFGKNLLYPIAKVFFLIFGMNLPSHPEFSLRINPLFPDWGERFRGTSYLAFAYWDFGWLGILIIPYLLGFISSFLFFRKSLASQIALVFIYLVIVWSYAAWPFWFPFFFGGFILAIGQGMVTLIRIRVQEIRRFERCVS